MKSNITDEEFSILDAVMKRHKTVKKYIIDREENALTLYVSGDYDEIRSYLKDEDFRKMQQYDEKMRFEKNATGEFHAQKICFVSKYYGWITMETSDDLRCLAEKYCFHVDKESLLEFWIEGEDEPGMILVGEYSDVPVYGYK